MHGNRRVAYTIAMKVIAHRFDKCCGVFVEKELLICIFLGRSSCV